jgi:hypothetical protein
MDLPKYGLASSLLFPIDPRVSSLDATYPDAAAGFSRTSFEPLVEARLIRNGSDTPCGEIGSRRVQDRVEDLSAERPETIEVRHERTYRLDHPHTAAFENSRSCWRQSPVIEIAG